MSEVAPHTAEKALREIRRLCEATDPSRSETLIAMIKNKVDLALAPADERPCHWVWLCQVDSPKAVGQTGLYQCSRCKTISVGSPR
jgi:hypothetical protein